MNKKFKHTHIEKSKDINQHIYDQVKMSELKLTNEEQLALLKKLDKLFRKVTYLSWVNPATRRTLQLEWQRRRTVMRDQVGYANVSKMARDYNASIAGHNIRVRQRINMVFKYARMLTEEHNLPKTAARYFKEVNLHPNFFMSNKHIDSMLEDHTPTTMEVIDQINEIREILVRSVMKTAAEVSHKKFKQVSGEILDFSDLMQEAMLAGYEATLVFDSSKDSKWGTFCYQRMKNSLGKYVSENSRTVAIPRTITDQFSPVYKAVKRVGLSDYQVVSDEANRINAKMKQDSTGRKLKPKEIYTPEKVEKLLGHVKDWMSLDMTVNESADETREVALVETLSSDHGFPDAEAERAMTGRSLRRILLETFGEEDYPILSLRWGLDEQFPAPLEPAEVLQVWNERYPGKKMYQVRIKSIEAEALKYLQEEKPEELLELWEAYSHVNTSEE